MIIEYSSFFTLVLYIFAFLLFVLDILLTLYRSQIEHVFIDFNSTNCLVLNDDMDIRITRPLIELTSVFVYILINECVLSDSGGRFLELYNYVNTNYPKCPLGEYDILKAHNCCHKSFLPTRHWIFQQPSAKTTAATSNEFFQLFVMWCCSGIQASILYFAPCFSQGSISYSNYEFMAFLYSLYTFGFSIYLWSITVTSTIMEWKIKRFYRLFEKDLFTFLTFTPKMDSNIVIKFFNSIGRNGIAYLVRMGDVCGTAKLNYLLMVLICEYYRLNEPLPFDGTWDTFENAYLEHIHSGKKSETSLLLDSILNSSTYEHFDDLEAQKEIISDIES
uniref:Innexin n=1 Tax=Panagrolaimus sp. ES5 TaxID=591445 RepID=A0AC34GVL9_9BILA